MRPAPDRPNVILIFADQWRGDCLSHQGHPIVKTPFIDELAARGASLSCAYSATPSCIAARASLFTGQSPRTHGRVGYQDGVPWNYETTLAGEFTRAGYQTQAVGKMHVFPERERMGFDNVVLHDGFLHHARKHHRDMSSVDDYIPWLRRETGRPDADYFDHGVSCNSWVARPWDKEEYLHPTNYVVSQSIDFLRRRDPRRPFFLFMSFHRPHPPYDPPQWAFDMYNNQEMPDPRMGDWTDYFKSKRDDFNPCADVGHLDRETMRRARAGYYGHMTHIDHQINRFVEALPDNGIDIRNTWIIFSADHGEQMGDHDMFRKSYGYEGSARIPFIVVPPFGSKAIPAGSQPRMPAELRDIMPTLLDCAGIDIPDSVEGESLLPVLRGETTGWREYIHGEHTRGPLMSPMFLTDGKEKYIWFSGDGHEQFFDLVNDPMELHDLAKKPDAAERVSVWRQRLIKELTGREEGFTDGKTLIPGRPVQPALKHIRVEK
ncbi:MAG: arylsulfatase [Planctomycetota bacterium]